VDAITSTSEAGAAKVAGGDADHVARLTADHDATADDRRIAAEPSHPERMAQDDSGGVIGGEHRVEQAPGRGLHAEQLEVVRGHAMAPDALGAAGTREAHRRRGRLVAVDVLERGRPFAQVDEIGERDLLDVEVAAGFPADVDEPAGIGDPGRRPPQQRVGHGEDRRIHADSDGQREHGGQGEQRRAPERPDGVPQVPSQVVEPHDANRFVIPLLDRHDAAEPLQRCGTRRRRRQAFLDETIGLQGNVRFDLRLEVFVPATHGSDGSAPRMPPIAVASRRQLSASVTSSWRPFLVSV
jgi:hypothetical protein